MAEILSSLVIDSDYLFQQVHFARKTIHLLMHDTFLFYFFADVWEGYSLFISPLNTMVRLILKSLITTKGRCLS